MILVIKAFAQIFYLEKMMPTDFYMLQSVIWFSDIEDVAFLDSLERGTLLIYKQK